MNVEHRAQKKVRHVSCCDQCVAACPGNARVLSYGVVQHSKGTCSTMQRVGGPGAMRVGSVWKHGISKPRTEHRTQMRPAQRHPWHARGANGTHGTAFRCAWRG